MWIRRKSAIIPIFFFAPPKKAVKNSMNVTCMHSDHHLLCYVTTTLQSLISSATKALFYRRLERLAGVKLRYYGKSLKKGFDFTICGNMYCPLKAPPEKRKQGHKRHVWVTQQLCFFFFFMKHEETLRLKC